MDEVSLKPVAEKLIRVEEIPFSRMMDQYVDVLTWAGRLSIYDEDYGEVRTERIRGSRQRLAENFEVIGDDEKPRVFRSILDRISVDIKNLHLFEGGYYINAITKLVNLETEAGRQMGRDLLDFAYINYANKLRPRWDNLGFAKGLSETERMTMMFLYEPVDSPDVYLDALSESIDDPEFSLKVGMMIKAVGMPAMADRLRFRLSGSDLSQERRFRLEYLLRDILGYPELEELYKRKGFLKDHEHLPLALNLADVYKNYDFSNYRVSQETDKFRLQTLERIFKRFEVEKGSRGCDIGCGTGWLTNELAAAGYNMLGIDIDPVNLEKARKQYLGVSFEEINISELGAGMELFDWAVELGRTATHAEDWEKLRVQMCSINETLVTNGLLIVDWPDPQAIGGLYEEQTNCVRDAYRRHGFTDDELDGLDVLVDGPATVDDRSLFVYNRLVPKIKDIRMRALGWGFNVVMEVAEELPNGTGRDRNIILVLSKSRDVEVT